VLRIHNEQDHSVISAAENSVNRKN